MIKSDIIQWLAQKPSQPELQAAYPLEWKTVHQDITAIMLQGDISQLQNYIITSFDHKQLQTQASTLVKKHMAELIIRDYCVSAATGVHTGKIRFNKFNGYIIQKLCFVKGLERKPVSLFWFKLFWPFLWQRRYLMPLVEPKGIYCFYSKELVNALAEKIGSRTCIEIAAGDGTLSRFLKNKGSNITASDDHSWGNKIKFPPDVINLDAKKALNTYKPEVVICSWPPTNNQFEACVFTTKSVQMYIVIGSKLKLACGNWQAYENQSTFNFCEDPHLSRLMLPPELGSAVTIFTRKLLSKSN